MNSDPGSAFHGWWRISKMQFPEFTSKVAEELADIPFPLPHMIKMCQWEWDRYLIATMSAEICAANVVDHLYRPIYRVWLTGHLIDECFSDRQYGDSDYALYLFTSFVSYKYVVLRTKTHKHDTVCERDVNRKKHIDYFSKRAVEEAFATFSATPNIRILAWNSDMN
jgi:hypothetical protein